MGSLTPFPTDLVTAFPDLEFSTSVYRFSLRHQRVPAASSHGSSLLPLLFEKLKKWIAADACAFLKQNKNLTAVGNHTYLTYLTGLFLPCHLLLLQFGLCESQSFDIGGFFLRTPHSMCRFVKQFWWSFEIEPSTWTHPQFLPEFDWSPCQAAWPAIGPTTAWWLTQTQSFPSRVATVGGSMSWA
jgi:hypothetical protein